MGSLRLAVADMILNIGRCNCSASSIKDTDSERNRLCHMKIRAVEVNRLEDMLE